MNVPEHGPPEPEPQDVRLARIEERLESIQKHGATKAEVDALRAAIEDIQKNGATKADAAALRSAIEDIQKHGATQSEVDTLKVTVTGILEHGATKADLRELETRMIKWIVGTGVAIAGLFVAAVGLLLTMLPRLILPR